MGASTDWIGWNSRLPKLGVGLGYRDFYRTDVFRHASAIDFLEITADHFFPAFDRIQRRPWSRWLPWRVPGEDENESFQLLDLLSRQFTLIPHGLSLSLGSADGLHEEYLELFAKLVDRIDPPWWSEHIAFTKSGGIDIGHLTPLPKTHATLRVLQSNIRRAQDKIQRPLILENITESIRFPQDTMGEAEFLGEIAEANHCGILLDVTNLYINSVHYRFDPIQVVERLPKDRIVQLHFVGYHREGDYLIDGHAHATNDEIWDLLTEVVAHADVNGAILERDERFPPFAQLKLELEQMRTIWMTKKRSVDA